MAKPKTEDTTVSNPVAEAAPADGAPAAAKKAGGAAIILQTGPGAGMKRVDYIRQEFAKGRKRGEIAKELGVVYQIVFAATKDLGKPAEAAAPAAPAKAAAAAA